LVSWIKAPRGDHRENKAPALAEQCLISVRIALADFFWHMGEVEFDWPTATRLEVYEHRPVLRAEYVARVRLAVQKLFSGAALADYPSPALQRVAEKLTVRVGERRSAVASRHELLSLCDPICEVWRRDIELSHAGMQPLERICVVGW